MSDIPCHWLLCDILPSGMWSCTNRKPSSSCLHWDFIIWENSLPAQIRVRLEVSGSGFIIPTSVFWSMRLPFYVCILYNEMLQESAKTPSSPLFDQMSKLMDNIWRGYTPLRKSTFTCALYSSQITKCNNHFYSMMLHEVLVMTHEYFGLWLVRRWSLIFYYRNSDSNVAANRLMSLF